MAITITGQPHNINPSNNTNKWEFSSDSSQLIYCIVEVKEPITGKIIAKKKVYPKPLATALSVDLSSVLTNVVESKLNNSNDVVSTSNLYGYELTITEYLINSTTGLVTVGNNISTGVKYVFDGEMGLMDYLKYQPNKFNINTTLNKAVFLSNKANINYVSAEQKELLKIFDTAKIGKKVKVTKYINNVSTDTLYDIPTAGNVININVSPSILFPTGADNIERYRVVIVDNDNIEVSDFKGYIIKRDCNKNDFTLIYKNPLGAWDTFTFNNRVETLNINKTYLNKSRAQTAVDSVLFNDKELINVDSKYSYNAYSDVLSDHDASLIKELLIANKVYIEIEDYFVEIAIDVKTYKVLQQRNNGFKRSRLTIDFSVGFSIDLFKQILIANRDENPQINYILSNFWSLVENDKGIEII
ncbi:MAG: hypothetical protein LBF27_00600 [Sphingobacterium sp.]|jgi:hypothetical protein|nr:hypothetical protein [Sphingobacterium sp.]